MRGEPHFKLFVRIRVVVVLTVAGCAMILQLLLSKDIECLAVKVPPNRSPKLAPFYGLLDVRSSSRRVPNRVIADTTRSFFTADTRIRGHTDTRSSRT